MTPYTNITAGKAANATTAITTLAAAAMPTITATVTATTTPTNNATGGWHPDGDSGIAIAFGIASVILGIIQVLLNYWSLAALKNTHRALTVSTLDFTSSVDIMLT